MAEKLSDSSARPSLVENRPGAGGTIGVGAGGEGGPRRLHAARALVLPHRYADHLPDTPYDTLRDLAGVTPLACCPTCWSSRPPRAASVKELVAAAKAKPGNDQLPLRRRGSATHLNAERFRLGAGIEVVHVPFKGTPEALTEVLTGARRLLFLPGHVRRCRSSRTAGCSRSPWAAPSGSRCPTCRPRWRPASPTRTTTSGSACSSPRRRRARSSSRLYQETPARCTRPTYTKVARLGAEPWTTTPGENSTPTCKTKIRRQRRAGARSRSQRPN